VIEYRPDANGIEEYDDNAHLSRDTMARIGKALAQCDGCLQERLGTQQDRVELEACRAELERARRGWTFRAGYATGALSSIGAGLMASQLAGGQPSWDDAPYGVNPPS